MLDIVRRIDRVDAFVGDGGHVHRGADDIGPHVRIDVEPNLAPALLKAGRHPLYRRAAAADMENLLHPGPSSMVRRCIMAGGAQGKSGQSPPLSNVVPAKAGISGGWARSIYLTRFRFNGVTQGGDGFFYRTVTENRWSMNALPSRSTR